MIILVGESGSGKSSIERCLCEKFGFKRTISYTTRSPRAGEVDGVDYYFVTEEKFSELEDHGFFAETATYNGWHYGTAWNECDDDKVAVLTPHGMRSLKKVPDIYPVAFYIRVPRRERLIKLLQRGDDIEEAYCRSLSDVGRFDGIEDEVDFVLDNAGYRHSVESMAAGVIELLTNGE